ncbi:CoA transferase [Pseudooceanicola sp. LIPI14-2-Ac024]|uniref:CoA transferase n=1 Tax=Pseudooceanicola sp. LIPI14-2-Ac024 TaxID=3344875 RepID=UPI0035D0AFDD
MNIEAPVAAGTLEALSALRGRPFATEIRVPEVGPSAPSRFRCGDTAAAVLGAIGGVVGDIVQARGGTKQVVSCDPRHAVAALAMSSLTRVPGAAGWVAPEVPANRQVARACIRPWATRDGGHVLPHLSLPNLQAKMLELLDCDLDPASVGAAVGRWEADALEEAIAAAGLCGGKVRSEAEWRAHPHGQALAARPVISIERIGDAPPEPVPGGARPLSGLRVLDLTRILAGPVAGRTLAEHGADVLMVAARKAPQVEEFVRDTSHGKRSCFLDLDEDADAARLHALVRGADVFLQGYRPGRLEARGFGPAQLARERPGIVCISVSCYGHGGPLSDRAGWEQVAQTVTGMCAEHGGPATPELVPLPVNDYVTGFLGALGALIALERRAEEGGSWHVQVSLCRTAMFLQDQGRWAAPGAFPEAGVLQEVMVESDGARGPMRHVGPVLRMSATPPLWARQAPVLGQDSAEWA